MSYLEDLEYDESQKLVTARKQTEEGYQILEMHTPCLVTVLASAVKPRYMNMRGIVTAYDREVEVWHADRIDVSDEHIGKTGSPTSVFKSFPKALKPAGETFEPAPKRPWTSSSTNSRKSTSSKPMRLPYHIFNRNKR